MAVHNLGPTIKLGTKKNKKKYEDARNKAIEAGTFIDSKGNKPEKSKKSSKKEKHTREDPPTIDLGGKEPRDMNTIDLGGKEPRDMDILDKGLVSFTNPVKTATEGFEAGAESFKEQSLGENILRASGSAAVVGTGLGLAAVGIGGALAARATQTAIQSANAQQIAAGTRLLTQTPKVGIQTLERGGNIFKLRSISQNGKTYALQKTYLQKLVSVATDPKVTLGIMASVLYTSLFWGPNEKGDALMTLVIAQKTALDAENYEMVYKIDKQIQEVNDIAASVPVVGFIKAEWAKFGAAATASETAKAAADKAEAEAERISAQGGTDFEVAQRERDEKKAERDAEFAQAEKDRNTRQDERDKKFTADQEARDEKEKRNTLIMQDVWRLRREGKIEEADTLELTKFE